MSDSKYKRISIGFAGGQVLPARVESQSAADLELALAERREGWHELACDDGAVRLDLQQVVYLRVESEDARVGFGA